MISGQNTLYFYSGAAEIGKRIADLACKSISYDNSQTYQSLWLEREHMVSFSLSCVPVLPLLLPDVSGRHKGLLHGTTSREHKLREGWSEPMCFGVHMHLPGVGNLFCCVYIWKLKAQVNTFTKWLPWLVTEHTCIRLTLQNAFYHPYWISNIRVLPSWY